jgi:hypothetical protein
MTRTYILLGFALIIVITAVALVLLQPTTVEVQTEAALPGPQSGAAAEPPLPPCSHLEGVERERCRLFTRQEHAERNAEPGLPPSARAARGSGVEGVTSSGSTIEAPGR